MPDLTRFRPVLWAAIGVCLVAGLVAVPIVDDGRGDDELRTGGGTWVGSAPSASSTTVADGTLSPGGDGGDVAPADAGDGGDSGPVAGVGGSGSGGVGGSSAGDAPASGARPGPAPAGQTPNAGPSEAPASTNPPTAAAPSEDLGPPGDPGPATVPRSGLYRYKASDARGERETTTTIEDRPPTGAPERRQLVSLRGDDIDTDNEVSWRADGVYVQSTVIIFGESRGMCDWEPDTVQLKLPLAKGTSWESTSTCNMTGIGPTPIPVTRKLTGKLLEVRRVRVAGQVLDVWAIETTERLEGGGRSGDRAGVALFSPRHGMVVSSSGKATSPEGSSDYRSDIQNLDPA